MYPLILTSHELQQQRSDMAHPFVQEANFFYLTKIAEPGWTLVALSEDDMHLIAPDIEDTRRIFDGGMSSEDAKKVSGIGSILSADDGKEMIDKLARKETVVYTLGEDPNAKYYDHSLNAGPVKLRQQLEKQFKEVRDCRPEFSRMRAIKSEEELVLMQTAIDQTCESFERVKGLLGKVKYEYELEAEFGYDFRRSGLDGYAYEPIVASGGSACTLHYNTNDQPLPDNGLVLLDVGASYKGYCSDITRTFAVGTPTKRQRAVHDAVERAHHAIIDIIAPGVSLSDYTERVDDIMKEALSGLGLLNYPDDYRKYFPHSISHGLGIDVHESLGGLSKLETGMVLTVEPGIYIPEEGIGVRIEDNILVTPEGRKNLSSHLPTSL